MKNISLSVITPSVRPEGLELVNKALRRQTYRDFEWLIVSPFEPEFECVWVKDPKKEKGDVWVLNKAYNRAIEKSKGDLIISWQDYTFASPQALEKFWYHYSETGSNILVSAVGNKYTDDTWTVQTWQDPRERDEFGTFYMCNYTDIEFNLASCPKKAFYAVGGFDESLDKYYGMDAYSVCNRLDLVGGWEFALDQTNKSYSLEHGRPDKWEEKNAIRQEVYGKKRIEYKKQPVLNYLK